VGDSVAEITNICAPRGRGETERLVEIHIEAAVASDELDLRRPAEARRNISGQRILAEGTPTKTEPNLSMRAGCDICHIWRSWRAFADRLTSDSGGSQTFHSQLVPTATIGGVVPFNEKTMNVSSVLIAVADDRLFHRQSQTQASIACCMGSTRRSTRIWRYICVAA
jgi:hypothetical protein